jgi:signal transduction histidine kinase/CHASE3 domain sensor protein
MHARSGSWRDVRLRWKLLGSFGIVLAMVVLEGIVASQASRRNGESAAWVEHTYQVMGKANDARAALLEMQTGYRGFLLTGKDEFLEPYRTGHSTFVPLLRDLEVLTVDNPAQVQRWTELDERAATWERDIAERGFALRRAVTSGSASPEEISAFAEHGNGRQQVDAMRNLLAEAIAVEQDLLNERMHTHADGDAHLLQFLMWGTASAIAIGATIAFLVQRSITRTLAQVALAARQIAHRDLPSLVDVAGGMAAGDFTRRASITAEHVRVKGRDELGLLADDFNVMIDRLHETDGRLDVIVRTVAEQRDTLSATLEASQDAILIVDFELKPKLSNDRFREWFGVSADELRDAADGSSSPASLARLDNLHETLTWGRQLLAEPERSATRRVEFVSGPIREADCYSAPIRSLSGPAVGRVFVFHDVSREAELARMKDEIVAVVSHELRTPLASLVGFAELLLVRSYDEAERREFLTIMADEGRRLTALVNDFLDLQRMESGRQQIAPSRTDLAALLYRAATAMGEDLERPIRMDLSAALPLVRADGERIHQLLINLLSNARKYSPGGGPVTVRARVADDAVQVTIQDAGLGIPAAALPQVFSKFYRVDSSDRREIKGTGLGLSIAKQIVESHGGRIWAESDGLGQGARFCFTLPIADATSMGGDVLVVEDDTGFARLLEAELAALGHVAVRVTSAEAAQAYLATSRPRLIVLDLLLPGLPGETFLQDLRRNDGGMVPVLVVTVKDIGASEQQVLDELHVSAVLRKGPGVAHAAALEADRLLQGPSAVAA